MSTRRVELKPPAELVEAIQNSDDMTAPGMDTTTEFSGNVPRTIRNRVVHETPQHLQHDEEEEEEREGSKMTKSERKELQARARFMESKDSQYVDTCGDFSASNKSAAGAQDSAMQSAANKNLAPRNKFRPNH